MKKIINDLIAVASDIFCLKLNRVEDKGKGLFENPCRMQNDVSINRFSFVVVEISDFDDTSYYYFRLESGNIFENSVSKLKCLLYSAEGELVLTVLKIQ